MADAAAVLLELAPCTSTQAGRFYASRADATYIETARRQRTHIADGTRPELVRRHRYEQEHPRTPATGSEHGIESEDYALIGDRAQSLAEWRPCRRQAHELTSTVVRSHSLPSDIRFEPQPVIDTVRTLCPGEQLRPPPIQF
jgi:hypothetical protein